MVARLWHRVRMPGRSQPSSRQREAAGFRPASCRAGRNVAGARPGAVRLPPRQSGGLGTARLLRLGVVVGRQPRTVPPDGGRGQGEQHAHGCQKGHVDGAGYQHAGDVRAGAGSLAGPAKNAVPIRATPAEAANC